MNQCSGRKYVCPRLLDYFVIVGNNQVDAHRKINFRKCAPQLLRRYPSKDHQDFELPSNIVYFCQPEGCTQTLPRKANNLHSSTNNTFVFALTDKDTNRVRYGICVNFYRLVKQKQDTQIPSTNDSMVAVVDCENQASRKDLCNQNPFLNSDDNLDKETLKCEQTNLIENLDSLRPESSVSQMVLNTQQETFKHHTRPVYINSLTSLCLISHHPFFSSFRECLFVLKNLIERCNSKYSKIHFDRNNNECTKTYPKKNIVWSLLTGESLLEDFEDLNLNEDLKQIEHYIFKLLSAPIPIAGRTKIELELMESSIKSALIIAYPEHTRFSLVDFPLHLPLELLGVDCCIQMITCILLEHKIILQSRDYNALCMSVMAFVAMLYPLEYMFPVIPLLPTSLDSAEQLLLAPTPYIIGIPASFLKSREKHFRLPNDVWLVDLDANRIYKPELAEDLPSLPEPEHTLLCNQLKAALQIMSNSNQMQTLNVSYNKQQLHPQLLFSENDVDCVDVAVRVAMINFFNSPNILANFTEHTRTLKLYPRPVVAVQINSFLQTRPKQSIFLNKLIRTQAVEYYAEYVLCPSNVAFLRVQTGLNSPQIVGDKVKWFLDTLKPICFKVWSICDNSFKNELLNKSDKSNSSFNLDLDLESDEECNSSEDKHQSELSSSYSSCSSLSDFMTDLFSLSDKSSTLTHTDLNNKSSQKNQLFCDESVYKPPSRLKLLSETGEIIDKQDSSENFNNELTRHSKASLSLTEKNLHSDSNLNEDEDHSSRYSSNSSISTTSATSNESNTEELKLFETTNYANLALDCKQDELTLNSNIDKQIVSFTNPLNEFITATNSSNSTESSTATIAAQTTNNSFLNCDQKMVTSEKKTYFQRPNSTSDDTSPRCTTPKKFHLFDLNLNLNKQTINNPENLKSGKEKMFGVKENKIQRTSASLDKQCLNNGNSSSSSSSSSPTLSNTMSISSVFSRNGSLANSMQNIGNNLSSNFHLKNNNDFNNLSQSNQTKNLAQPKMGSSFLDRFTKEAKGFTREALQATKNEMGERKNTFLKSLQALGAMETNKSNTNISSTSINSNLNTNAGQESSNLTSNLTANLDKFEFSTEFNGLADKTSSMLSGLFSSKMVDRVKEKVQQQQQQLAQLPQFPGRKGLIERSSLIKHASSNISSKNSNSDKEANSFVTKSNFSRLQHSENQNFLQDIINNLMQGEGISWLKFNRVKKLMEDENYRNFVVSCLNKTLERKLSPDDHIQDVEISKPVWKGMLKLILAIIHGLKYTYVHNGLGGMQSTLIVLEIAHTHYWAKEANEQINLNSISSTANTSPFGSNEHLNTSDTSNQISPYSNTNYTFQTIMSQKNQQQNYFENLNSEVSTPTTSSMNTNATPTCNVSETGSLTVNPVFLNRLDQVISYRTTCSDSELDGMDPTRQKRTSSIWSSKSNITTGLRYHAGNLINTNIHDTKRTYLFQGLIEKDKSCLWNDAQFWEDMFLDAVSQERELIGLDQGVSEMIERYQTLQEQDRKRLEHEEDRLLTSLLHNMVAFMVMLQVNHQIIQSKIRRLLGKCHIGVIYNEEINLLLQRIGQLQGNDIDLKPLASCQSHKQTFTLYIANDQTQDKSDKLDASYLTFNARQNLGQIYFMEVRDDGLILRNITGTIVERWWYERLVNMTYCPKNKVLCLWRRNGGQTQLHKYQTKKSKELYYCIKQAMDKAATRGHAPPPGTELGGEFPVQDVQTGEGGLLQVCMEGVGLLFAHSKFFIKLENIRKCFTQKGGIFVMEELSPKTGTIIERKYKSQMSNQICYSVLCVFSYVVAGSSKKKNTPKLDLQVNK